LEDTDILQHLLEIESQASTLVNDAQMEADRRVKEAEEQNRQAYDAGYQKLITELEAEYRKEQDAVKVEYDKALDEYRQSLAGMSMDANGFSALAFSLLLGEK